MSKTQPQYQNASQKNYELLNSFVRKLCPQCRVDLTVVKLLLRLRKIYKGEFLYREGDVCSFVGLIAKGCLRTFILKEGKELTIFFHSERHTLGDYESLRRQKPACFSCQAIEDSEILIIDLQIVEILETEPDGQKLLRLIVEDLAFALRDRLLSLYRDSPQQRYLDLLEREPKLIQRIPQYYIASYLGIEPESLSRLKRRIHQRRIS